MAATYLLFSVGVASGCTLVLVASASYAWSAHDLEPPDEIEESPKVRNAILCDL
jgi:hypothetical protein